MLFAKSDMKNDSLPTKLINSRQEINQMQRSDISPRADRAGQQVYRQ